MQNIDFSRQIRPSGLTGRPAPEPSASGNNPSGGTSRTRNRWISLGLAALVLVFAVGFYSGVRLGELRQVEAEDCVIQNPRGVNGEGSRSTSDQNASPVPNSNTASNAQTNASVALANIGSEGSSSTAYIIKVGTFTPPKATRMADRLNTLTGLNNLKVSQCKGVQENVPGRGVAFRMKAPGDQNLENVLVGCFAKDSLARSTLEVIRRSGLPGATRAELYEY